MRISWLSAALKGRFAGVFKKELYQAYCKWCEDNGENAITQRQLSERLQERGFVEEDERKKGRKWKHLGLQDAKYSQGDVSDTENNSRARTGDVGDAGDAKTDINQSNVTTYKGNTKNNVTNVTNVTQSEWEEF